MNQKFRKIAFLSNTNSRKGKEGYKNVLSQLKGHGWQLAFTEAYDEIDDLSQAMSRIKSENYDLLILGGGDGTLSLGAQTVYNTDIPMLPIPLGTGNQFCSEIGIHDYSTVHQLLNDGKIIKLDLGSLNGKTFINVASVGISTDIAQHLEFKEELGKFAYGPAFAKALKDHKIFKASLSNEKYVSETELFLLMICNGRTHGGPFLASPDASLYDGYLDIYGLKPTTILNLMKVGTQALLGEHINNQDVISLKTSKISLVTEPKLAVTLDGETTWHDEMLFSCLPASWNVLVPESYKCPIDRLV